MTQPFRIAIAGLGTVGTGVIKILEKHAAEIALRAGRPVEIIAVSARDKSKDRGVDLSGLDWVDDCAELAARDDIDAIVEMIGGSEGKAADLVRRSLAAGKHVVTANKALLAHHGYGLALLAEEKNISLAYEAAVAGGIPIIKTLREGFAANEIRSVYGILNGTCNYILTEMRETGRDFSDVLKEAQEKGYAEADPSFDVDGIDAGHKLALLSALAFGTHPDFENLKITGISHLTATDIHFAGELGYRIKLLGIARRHDAGIMRTLEPCLVPKESQLGSVEGVFNAVFIEGDFVGKSLSVGRGAGEGPTASAVVADLIDIARGLRIPAFGRPAKDMAAPTWLDAGKTQSRYYLRLEVLDEPGVIAQVSAILRDYKISIESMIQHGRDPGQPVSVVLTLHEVSSGAMQDACRAIGALDIMREKPCLMRIESL
ncbi:MAG: homoserine dehydrogenase [Alphaproteobacteria bacterium]|nr:homoserine dehydrogenase [Alphaproteobacteria bacterium]